MSKKTALHACHLKAGAHMVDFGGWEMPVNYGSQIEEHHQVRHDAGMFDVSHMTVVDLTGGRVREFLQFLLANDAGRLKTPGKAMYSCMLNEQGGVVDDLIVYFLREDWFRMVVNAATRDKDVAWISKQAKEFNVTVGVRDDTVMIAVQGPAARDRAAQVFPEAARDAALELKPFNAVEVAGLFIARTGYTGEDGFEIIMPAEQGEHYWHELEEAGVRPCGLGARDTLRLEAGMNLYGQDMDEQTSPLESGLGWTIAWEPKERKFIGREALEAQRASGVKYKQVGLVLLDKGVLRAHQKAVVDNVGAGELTSGSFSPTLERSIGFARVPVAIGDRCKVDIRGRLADAKVVKLPFVRNGTSLIEI